MDVAQRRALVRSTAKAAKSRGETDPGILDGTAKAFWFTSWADAQEECGESLSGMKIEDVAPAPPDAAYDLAAKLVAKFEAANGGEPIDATYIRAAVTPGKHDRNATAEDFGFAVAMQAMGSGVAWTDDHPDPEGGMSVPHMEVSWVSPEWGGLLECEGREQAD